MVASKEHSCLVCLQEVNKLLGIYPTVYYMCYICHPAMTVMTAYYHLSF